MPHVLIRHKVADFDKWKPAYDSHRARHAAGLTDLHLWRNENDPTEVVILFQAADAAKARAFAESPQLKDKMQAAGVQGRPDIVFLTEA